jgi:hypothetical protein
MKSLYIAIVLVAAPVWGGVRIKMEITDAKTNAVTQQELLLDTNRLRVNIGGAGGNSSMMFLTDGGNRLVMLDTARNEYRELDEQTMKQLSQQMQGAMAALQGQLQNMPPEQRAQVEAMMRGRGGQMLGQSAPAKTTYAAKGNGTVNGISCTKYEGTREGAKVAELCAAKPADLKFNPADFQVFEKMRDFVSSMTSSLVNSPFANAKLSDWTDQGVDGFPVQGIGYAGGQETDKLEVKSLERASFSDADFSLGSAKKVEMPVGRRGR